MKVALVITSTMCLILLGTLLFSGNSESEQKISQLTDNNRELQSKINLLEKQREYDLSRIEFLKSTRDTYVNQVDSLENELKQVPKKYEGKKNSIVIGDTSIILDILTNF